MTILCALEAIDTLEQWSALATRTGEVTVESFCHWMRDEHHIDMAPSCHDTLEDAMQYFVRNHVG